jgi:hypothetical protein
MFPPRKDQPIKQGGFGFEAGGYDDDRLKQFEVDCTPGPVVRQGFEAVDEILSPRSRLRVLDLCAGSGVFGQQARRVLKEPELVAVEIREEEKPNLDRHYDEVHIGDFREVVPTLGAFDLVITNPAFSLFVAALEAGTAVIRRGGAVVLLGLNELGTRGSASREAWDEHRPTWQWRIAGTLGFRGPGINPKTKKPWGTDTRSYSWWTWQRRGRREDLSRRTWSALDLPLLEAHGRSWKVRPGTEEAPRG